MSSSDRLLETQNRDISLIPSLVCEFRQQGPCRIGIGDIWHVMLPLLLLLPFRFHLFCEIDDCSSFPSAIHCRPLHICSAIIRMIHLLSQDGTRDRSVSVSISVSFAVIRFIHLPLPLLSRNHWHQSSRYYAWRLLICVTTFKIHYIPFRTSSAIIRLIHLTPTFRMRWTCVSVVLNCMNSIWSMQYDSTNVTKYLG